MNDDLLSLVEREVLGWPGTSSGPGRFGSVAFRYGRREIGHVHRDLIADLPVTQEMHERLLSRDRTGLAREATSATRWKVARTPRRSWRY
jgi:hypothetical protein